MVKRQINYKRHIASNVLSKYYSFQSSCTMIISDTVVAICALGPRDGRASLALSRSRSSSQAGHSRTSSSWIFSPMVHRRVGEHATQAEEARIGMDGQKHNDAER